MASRCWTVFSLRVRGTRSADIASDTPQIWGSPWVDDDRTARRASLEFVCVFDRTGPASQVTFSLPCLDTTRAFRIPSFGPFAFSNTTALAANRISRSMFEPLQTAINFDVGVSSDQPINDLCNLGKVPAAVGSANQPKQAERLTGKVLWRIRCDYGMKTS